MIEDGALGGVLSQPFQAGRKPVDNEVHENTHTCKLSFFALRAEHA
jgi:hypothetical protein